MEVYDVEFKYEYFPRYSFLGFGVSEVPGFRYRANQPQPFLLVLDRGLWKAPGRRRLRCLRFAPAADPYLWDLSATRRIGVAFFGVS